MDLFGDRVSKDIRWPNQVVFGLLTLSMLPTSIGAGMALACGFCYAALVGNPFSTLSKKLVSPLLGIAIVALGAGMDLGVVAEVGLRGLGYTFVSIALTLFLALALGKAFKVERKIAVLLGVGTAICGGSAIAAASGAIRAKPEEISVAMAAVFMLNALALYIFPELGALAALSQMQFGLWSALAVHDTSSVIATSMRYGPEALAVATTVKLARALWIAPLTLGLALVWPSSSEAGKAKIHVPWFILGFIGAAALVTYVPGLNEAAQLVSQGGKRMLVLTLFLVGANISFQSLKAVGWRALVHAVTLWIVVSILTLGAIYLNLIRL